MNLTIDIGNTRIKYQYWDDSGQPQKGGYAAELWEIDDLLTEVSSMAYCNVRGVKIPEFPKYSGKMLEVTGMGKFPFQLAYKTPETLGSDRICGVAGAHKLFPGKNVLCIDAGTCLKFDIISEAGVYLGGSISPGLKMRYKALNHYTGKLPEINDREWNAIYGASTEESILAGVQQGFLGETVFRISEFSKDFNDLYVILTGGDAPFLADRLKTRIFAEPLLVHYGLLHCLLNP